MLLLLKDISKYVLIFWKKKGARLIFFWNFIILDLDTIKLYQIVGKKCSKNKFLFLRWLFLFLDPSSLYQIVGNSTRNGVALMCFSKYFIVFDIFSCLDFLTLTKYGLKPLSFSIGFLFYPCEGITVSQKLSDH